MKTIHLPKLFFYMLGFYMTYRVIHDGMSWGLDIPTVVESVLAAVYLFFGFALTYAVRLAPKFVLGTILLTAGGFGLFLVQYILERNFSYVTALAIGLLCSIYLFKAVTNLGRVV